MKRILLLLAIISTLNAFAQQKNNNATINTQQTFLRAASAGQSQYGSTLMFYNPARQVDGSIHLLENWQNRGVLVTTDGQKFRINNVNINLKSQTFESRFHPDSVFQYSFNTIDRFIINNKPYKNYYYNEDNKIYEIIYETDEFSILKGYNLEFIEGSVNPMVNRRNDKYVQRDYYYVKTENKIERIKLKKNAILKYLDADKEVAEKILKYAKENGLSFKKEDDLRSILRFNETI